MLSSNQILIKDRSGQIRPVNLDIQTKTVAARKTEIEIVERQLKMFQPLKFTTPKDVEKIINEKIKGIK